MNTTEEKHQDENFDEVYDYSQYSRVRNVNVIPEQDFKRLVAEVFHTISENLRVTYGPYGRQVLMGDGNDEISTKDGFNTFSGLSFSHPYKKKVYQSIQKICSRVNRVVGDGTTSCILLADKIFNRINAIINTPDDMRNAMIALNKIEKDYQDIDKLTRDKDDMTIKMLTTESMRTLINLADNYDDELTEELMKAFRPAVTDDGNVSDVRNLIVEENIDPEAVTNIHYETYDLPGDYRVRVEMNSDVVTWYYNWKKVRIAIFDHVFTEDDWMKFYKSYDRENSPETIIMATNFSQKFLDNTYASAYAFYECKRHNKEPMIRLARIKGQFVQNEISDLCALLGTTKIKIETPVIDHTKFPEVEMMVFDKACMCFRNLNKPDEYIDSLKEEMNRDDSKSYIIKQDFLHRIAALQMEGYGDTQFKITGSTALEVKLVSDKIIDCISIVKSAIKYGIVPNMLKYGWRRTNEDLFENDKDKLKEFGKKVQLGIRESIEGLFIDIWRSKYLSTRDSDIDEQVNRFYEGPFNESYDIIDEEYRECDELPTSSQYDLEVLVAAISIVKYLITSGAYIFDSDIVGRGPESVL